MAVFGLTTPTKQKGKYSLQTVAQSALGDPEVDPNTLPSNPFSASPALSAGASAAPVEIQQIQQPTRNYTFTGKYDAANRELQAEESDAGFSRRNNLQAIAEAFQRGTSDAAIQQDKARRSLLQRLADMGASTSGGALDKDAELSSNYSRYLDDLARAKAADQAKIENNYAGILNSNARRRETLFGEQQAEEEARRIEESRLRAEAERQAVEAETRKQEMAALIESQERARVAAELAAQQAAAATFSYAAPSFGGGGGYSPSSPSYSEPTPESKIVLPFLNSTSNVPASAVNSWIKRTIDPTLQGAELQKVAQFLTKAGQSGTDRSSLGQFIASLRGGNASNSFFY
jgi:hypothetical protein